MLEANPQAKLYADPQTAAQLGERVDRPCTPGTRSASATRRCAGVGGTHAVIHPELPVIDNIPT